MIGPAKLQLVHWSIAAVMYAACVASLTAFDAVPVGKPTSVPQTRFAPSPLRVISACTSGVR